MFRENVILFLAFFGLLLGGVFFSFGFKELAHGIWFATLLCGGAPIVYRTILGMFRGQFASDIVAMLAIITACILNEAFAGAVVVLMQSGGEAIERYGFKKASSSLAELFERAPRRARRKQGDFLEEIDVKEVNIGDVLVVRPGEMVPVDGTILKGKGMVDDSAITGEPLDKEKQEGSSLFSGSISVDGAIEMRADKKSEESQYAKIVKLVQRAQEEKAPIQRLADRAAIFFTPLTLLMAAIGFAISQDFLVVLSVLVVATPCPLILATPLAVICGVNRAAKEGIIVKGGSPLELVASVDAMLFDKTGTITLGTPAIEAILPFNRESKEDLLYHAAAVEQLSSHGLAKMIVSEGLKIFPTLPLPTHFQEIPGQGVKGELEGHRYWIGSKSSLAIAKECPLPQDFEKKATVYVVKDDVCIGAIVLKDSIRPEASSVISWLKRFGVKEIMLVSGDKESSAREIAKHAGISQVAAELLPEQKVSIVKEYKKKYSTLVMVGDGINDAPALASASVGIAMGAHGTAISAEAADIVLLVDDLSKVVRVVAIGKRMLYIAKQSIFIGIGCSFLLMCIALFGVIPPPLGAGLQEVIDITVILNALRVLNVSKINDFVYNK